MEIYCCVCQLTVPPDRANRAGKFCSEDCRRAYKKWRRNLKAGRYCRLCKRPKAKARQEASEQALDMCAGRTA